MMVIKTNLTKNGALDFWVVPVMCITAPRERMQNKINPYFWRLAGVYGFGTDAGISTWYPSVAPSKESEYQTSPHSIARRPLALLSTEGSGRRSYRYIIIAEVKHTCAIIIITKRRIHFGEIKGIILSNQYSISI